MLDNLSVVAQIVGGFAAGAAVVYAYIQVRQTLSASREAAALEAYRQYLAACVEHPELSSYPMFSKSFPDEFKNGIRDRLTEPVQRYFWFLSVFLNTAEGILDTVPRNDTAWRRVIDTQLGYHREVLKAMWAKWKDSYSDELGVLVDKVLRNPSPAVPGIPGETDDVRSVS